MESIKDFESVAAALYDGGYRYTDKTDIVELGISEKEADIICGLLYRYETE